MRAAIYARFSTDLQREESIKDQFRYAERTAAAQGFAVVAHYGDEGISGGTAERLQYQEMITAARSGAFDIIIAEDISRLWRNRAEYGQRSAEFEDLGVHIVTCVGDDTRRDGWMIITIKLAMAEQMRRDISYKTRRGLEGLALAGKSTGGRCFGYRDGQIVPGEAETIRCIFADAYHGASLAVIAKRLNDCGHPGPRGNGWSRSTIAAILANRRYTGAVIWGATEGKGGARDSRLKTRRMRPQGPIVSFENPALAIISKEIFETVQKHSLDAV